jgi:DNA polymerase III subunit epsilon
MRFAIVDIETTGGSPKSSKITEIAVYVHDGEKILDEFVSLVNPEMRIPEFISRLTGINDRMVEEAPKFYEIAKRIIEITEGCIFVAHNVGFDYSILRNEYKLLGFDFRRPHLCTVRASRYIIPGMESYSLGKLTSKLGIEIHGRHRAGGDALATAHLFRLLFDKDLSNLQTFIQQEVNPKILHPNLDLEQLDELPSKTGIYKFFNEVNQLIYIGKSKDIKKRVEQHLRNSTTKKGIQMRQEIAKIEFELTGSELIALLLESEMIKMHQPVYNRMLRKNKFPYGLYDYTDDLGYRRFHIGLTSKSTAIPLTSFTAKKEGTSYIEFLCDKFELCQKLCDLYPTSGSCFYHSIKKCKGACAGIENTESYNVRADQLIDEIMFTKDSFYIIDKGRHKSEKSLILIERGSYIGYGYAPYHFNSMPSFRWKKFIETRQDNRDSRTILSVHLRKNSELQKLKF